MGWATKGLFNLSWGAEELRASRTQSVGSKVSRHPNGSGRLGTNGWPCSLSGVAPVWQRTQRTAQVWRWMIAGNGMNWISKKLSLGGFRWLQPGKYSLERRGHQNEQARNAAIQMTHARTTSSWIAHTSVSGGKRRSRRVSMAKHMAKRMAHDVDILGGPSMVFWATENRPCQANTFQAARVNKRRVNMTFTHLSCRTGSQPIRTWRPDRLISRTIYRSKPIPDPGGKKIFARSESILSLHTNTLPLWLLVQLRPSSVVHLGAGSIVHLRCELSL